MKHVVMATAACLLLASQATHSDTAALELSVPDGFSNTIDSSLGTEVAPGWLVSFYKAAPLASNATDIYPLISGISSLFGSKDYASVDYILQSAPIETFSLISMITLVRTTFPAKNKLENWNSAVGKVKQIVVARGEDPSKLLRGLI